jgi:hypothetical protein
VGELNRGCGFVYIVMKKPICADASRDTRGKEADINGRTKPPIPNRAHTTNTWVAQRGRLKADFMYPPGSLDGHFQWVLPIDSCGMTSLRLAMRAAWCG